MVAAPYERSRPEHHEGGLESRIRALASAASEIFFHLRQLLEAPGSGKTSRLYPRGRIDRMFVSPMPLTLRTVPDAVATLGNGQWE
jgi:hypothetical protein